MSTNDKDDITLIHTTMKTKKNEITPDLMDDIFEVISSQDCDSHTYTGLILTLDALDDQALACTMYGCYAAPITKGHKRRLIDIANACCCILNVRGVDASLLDVSLHIAYGDWVYERDAPKYVKDLVEYIITAPVGWFG